MSGQSLKKRRACGKSTCVALDDDKGIVYQLVSPCPQYLKVRSSVHEDTPCCNIVWGFRCCSLALVDS